MSDLAVIRPKGNAIVPGDAPIQPPQVYVDCFPALMAAMESAHYVLSAKGMTELVVGTDIDFGIAAMLNANMNFQGSFNLDVSGNALASIDQILADIVSIKNSQFWSGLGNVIDLSGGANAAPTRNSVLVGGAGTSAANGVYTPRGTHAGKAFYNLIGAADSITVNAITFNGSNWGLTDNTADALYVADGDTSAPWTAHWASNDGAEPPPTVTQANADLQILSDAGWTVTTN